MLRHRYKASALLTALFVTALAAIIATAVIYKFRLMLHLAMLDRFSNQATLYLQGVNDQAEADIAAYRVVWQAPKMDIPNLTLPRQIGPQKFEGMELEAKLIDANSLYNINNLVSANNQLRFTNLLRYVDPNLSSSSALQIAENITDWLSKGNSGDQIYARRDPPYRAAHRPMQNISELRLVAGISAKLYQRLAPYLIALPMQNSTQASQVNINTALPTTLLTLSPQMTIDKAKSLYDCRRGHGVFFSTDDYNKTCVTPLGIGALSGISISSNAFLIKSSATSNDGGSRNRQQVLLSSLISTVKDPKTNMTIPYVIWQTSG